MANFVYTRAKRDLLKGDLDFDEAGNDLRVILCMTNTTADTEEDTATISAFTTLDEHDGASYARQTLDTQTVTEDQPNDQAEFDAVDVTISTLGAGTRAVAGCVIYKHVTNDTDSIPLIWMDTPAFPNSNGGDYTLQWAAEGLLKAT